MGEKGNMILMKEVSGREVVHVGTCRWGDLKYWQVLALKTGTQTSHPRDKKQALKRQREITDSSQKYSGTPSEKSGNSSKCQNVCQPYLDIEKFFFRIKSGNSTPHFFPLRFFPLKPQEFPLWLSW